MLLYVPERFLRLWKLLPQRWLSCQSVLYSGGSGFQLPVEEKKGQFQLIWEICPYYSLVSWLPASGCLHHPYNHTRVHVVTSMSCPLLPLENRCLPDCSCETPVPVMDLLLVAGHQQQCLVWKGELKGKQNVWHSLPRQQLQ